MNIFELVFVVSPDILGMQANRGKEVVRKALADILDGLNSRYVHSGNENGFYAFGLLLCNKRFQVILVLRVVDMCVSVEPRLGVRV